MILRKADDFIANGGNLDELLKEAVGLRDMESLLAVRRLFEHMYGGYTFNFEIKAAAAACLVCWGELGLRALADGALATPRSKNLSLSFQVLVDLAGGDELPVIQWINDADLRATVLSASKRDGISSLAGNILSELVFGIEEQTLADNLGHLFTMLAFGRKIDAQRRVFSAIAARWLSVSKPVLDRFERLLLDHPDEEPMFQDFLTEYPQLLDPMAVEIWPQPDLHGAKEPDFVIRRSDNSYLVVEIEKPSKGLVTGGGQLTSEVTQAEGQVAEYRTFLTRRYAETQKIFPGLEEPDGLVVIGLERNLTDEQKEVLAAANRQRQKLRIVGFDYLADRAQTISSNVISTSIGVRSRTRMI